MTNRKNWPAALSVGPSAMNAESFTALANAGIHQIELSSGAVEPYYKVLDYPRRAAEISALARENGVTISSIHLPFGPFANLDPATGDPEIRRDIIKKQTELISAAAEADIKIAVIHPSGEPYNDSEREVRLNNAVETLAPIAEYAHKAGVSLALENLPRTCLCRTHDEMLYVLSKIPTMKVCFDLNHSLLEKNVDYIRAVGDKIITIHVSDYDFIDERHLLPGRGLSNWEELISTLEEVNYSGRFLYELHDGQGTYEEIYANYKKLMGI